MEADFFIGDTMLTIVYAPAHNELRMAVTAFFSYEKAVETLKGIFGPDAECEEKTKNGKRIFTIANKGKRTVCPDGHIYITRNEEITEEQAEKLFIYYYGGCGECLYIVAQEIDDGELPLFPFDQD
jgi:hypothetical protein